ncbi:MAG: hypothetical protein A2096_07510 [Spirochaetes bacterium GWF1_41_5]|nr:MAG: hypothetical protein A2096_07510 [Spirochaetes bacterium GWF1_41_5]HBE01930.1 hypothetical protein [Spirochaetia bacterium]
MKKILLFPIAVFFLTCTQKALIKDPGTPVIKNNAVFSTLDGVYIDDEECLWKISMLGGSPENAHYAFVSIYSDNEVKYTVNLKKINHENWFGDWTTEDYYGLIRIFIPAGKDAVYLMFDGGGKKDCNSISAQKTLIKVNA